MLHLINRKCTAIEQILSILNYKIIKKWVFLFLQAYLFPLSTNIQLNASYRMQYFKYPSPARYKNLPHTKSRANISSYICFVEEKMKFKKGYQDPDICHKHMNLFAKYPDAYQHHKRQIRFH